MIRKSIENSASDFSEEHMKVWLLEGHQNLLVIVEEGKIIGCGTVNFVNHPNCRVAFITSCGGKDIVSRGVFGQVEEWARSMGATKIQAWAKEGQARLYRQAVGFRDACTIVEKNL
jgi:hypothetical protein